MSYHVTLHPNIIHRIHHITTYIIHTFCDLPCITSHCMTCLYTYIICISYRHSYWIRRSYHIDRLVFGIFSTISHFTRSLHPIPDNSIDGKPPPRGERASWKHWPVCVCVSVTSAVQKNVSADISSSTLLLNWWYDTLQIWFRTLYGPSDLLENLGSKFLLIISAGAWASPHGLWSSQVVWSL